MVLSTLFLGGHLMANNDITAGQLMAFLVASQGVQRSLSQGSVLLGTTIRGMTAGARVFEVLKVLIILFLQIALNFIFFPSVSCHSTEN